MDIKLEEHSDTQFSKLTHSERMELYDAFSSVFCHFDDIYIKQFSVFGAFHTVYIGYISQVGSDLFKDNSVMWGGLCLIFMVSIFSLVVMIRNRSWLRRYQVGMAEIEDKYLPLPRTWLIPTSLAMMVMIVIFSLGSAAITLKAGGLF